MFRLESKGKIKGVADGGYRRFYPVGQRFHPRDRVALAFVNKPGCRKILEIILNAPGVQHQELADLASMPVPTLTYFVKSLRTNKLVRVRRTGPSCFYRLVNPALIEKALQRTAEGFDEAIARG